MPRLLKAILTSYQAPAGDDGADTGGTDVIERTEPTTAEDRGDVIDPALNADTLQALVDAGGGGAGDPPDGAAAAAAGSEEDDAGQVDKPSGIPKSRFNEVNEQRKEAERRAEAAEQEVAALRAAAAKSPPADAAPAFDEDAKEEAYADALMNGDTKGAAAIRKEINAHLRSEATAHARHQAQADYDQRAMANALNAESQRALQEFPFLDTEAGAEALELIVASRNAKIARGMPAHEALRAAVDAIAHRFAPPARGLQNESARTDSRTAAALARGAADSTAQPPSMHAGIGNRATASRVNVEQLSDEQFANLSEAEKKRLRGD